MSQPIGGNTAVEVVTTTDVVRASSPGEEVILDAGSFDVMSGVR